MSIIEGRVLRLLTALLLPSVCVAQTDDASAWFEQPEYQTAVRYALLFHMQVDSLQRLIEENSALLLTAAEQEKASIRTAIRNDNALAAVLRREAEEWFSKANRYVTANRQEVTIRQKDDYPESDDEHPASTLLTKTPDNTAPEFKILAYCPYSPKNPIPIDPPLPGGVIYKIQLGAFGKPVAVNVFRGLSPVSGEKLPSGIIKYYVGLFRAHAEAENALREVKKYGYGDAFIVAFYNRKSIITTRAQELEKIANK
ncbi:MAG: hypothetical protein LBR08_03960 [Bacteroidales bacterium]|jgi:hypothetical protein|nr:hypothetical protein [Bacteroidales bacterium]